MNTINTDRSLSIKRLTYRAYEILFSTQRKIVLDQIRRSERCCGCLSNQSKARIRILGNKLSVTSMGPFLPEPNSPDLPSHASGSSNSVVTVKPFGRGMESPTALLASCQPLTASRVNNLTCGQLLYGCEAIILRATLISRLNRITSSTIK
jgi:hypothetical protein